MLRRRRGQAPGPATTPVPVLLPGGLVISVSGFMITRRLLVRPAESSRSTESCPRDSTENPPSCGNSPPPDRQLSATRTATLHHTATFRDPHGNRLWLI